MNNIGSEIFAFVLAFSAQNLEERSRIREPKYNAGSVKIWRIMIASFLAHTLRETLTERGAEASRELDRVTTLLDDIISEIVHGFERQETATESIPQGEAGSMRRFEQR